MKALVMRCFNSDIMSVYLIYDLISKRRYIDVRAIRKKINSKISYFERTILNNY